MTLTRILAAVDGSVHTAKVSKVAAEAAQRYGARLFLLHVVAPVSSRRVRDELENLAHMEHLERTEYEMLQDSGRPVVRSAEASAREKGIADVEGLVEVGDPASVIMMEIRARRADLVVLGRRGLGTLTGLLLGSVSHKVIQLATIPCLIVP